MLVENMVKANVDKYFPESQGYDGLIRSTNYMMGRGLHEGHE